MRVTGIEEKLRSPRRWRIAPEVGGKEDKKEKIWVFGRTPLSWETRKIVMLAFLGVLRFLLALVLGSFLIEDCNAFEDWNAIRCGDSRMANLDDKEGERDATEKTNLLGNGWWLEWVGRVARQVGRGLYKFFEGKSKSFRCLPEVRCIEDLAKQVTPSRKRLKASVEYGFDLTQKRCNKPRFNDRTISKKTTSKGSSVFWQARRNRSGGLPSSMKNVQEQKWWFAEQHEKCLA
ncbi:hypothetical protein ZIOFF_031688 [Zingiber officinale]|uniref:Uncharacterized protein n=1 Tax=Zingiber officinale TaxID=94328 RepID=A0A8J5GLR9_ZINOF|nr:hypothetical protein ZIOFF_031688 [Zingiber officinale]